MQYLIDTQLLLWIFGDNTHLSPSALAIIKSTENQLFVSAASFWEIAIKLSLGKLSLPIELVQLVEETISNNIAILGIEINHILQVTSLPFHHRDPFDRLIIAQSIAGNLPIISSDDKFLLYAISRIW